MPAKAGIQEHTAQACDYTAWIPGLALLARNDASQPAPQDHCDELLVLRQYDFDGLGFVMPALRQAQGERGGG